MGGCYCAPVKGFWLRVGEGQSLETSLSCPVLRATMTLCSITLWDHTHPRMYPQGASPLLSPHSQLFSDWEANRALEAVRASESWSQPALPIPPAPVEKGAGPPQFLYLSAPIPCLALGSGELPVILGCSSKCTCRAQSPLSPPPPPSLPKEPTFLTVQSRSRKLHVAISRLWPENLLVTALGSAVL